MPEAFCMSSILSNSPKEYLTVFFNANLSHFFFLSSTVEF